MVKNKNGDMMKHTIDLKKYELRTDLVDETINKHKIDGLIKEETIDNVKVSTIKIDDNASKIINKKVGDYITIEFDDVTDYDNKEKVKKIFSEQLKKLLTLTNISDNATCLVIGLGNPKSTPDSLGPSTINNIIVTNHLFAIEDIDGFRRVSAISPNVTGVTGIETHDLIKSVTKMLKPDFLIVIDALASSSINRVNKTIQMSNTGIAPGSGIGNNRKDISYDSLKIPVISIGVPTVVDAITVVSDTLNFMMQHYSFSKEYLKKPISKLTTSVNYLDKEINIDEADKENLLGLVGSLTDDELKELLFEVLTPIGYNLMVTPKEVDFVIEKLSDIIGNGINKVLHRNVNNL